MIMKKLKNTEKNFPALCFHSFFITKNQMLIKKHNLNNLAHKPIALFEYYALAEKNEISIN